MGQCFPRLGAYIMTMLLIVLVVCTFCNYPVLLRTFYLNFIVCKTKLQKAVNVNYFAHSYFTNSHGVITFTFRQ